MTTTGKPPYGYYTDVDGASLENAKIYIGTAGLDAVTNPIVVYWDAAETTPATQPIRTIGGVPDNAGTPADFFAPGDFSITILTSADVLVYSKLQVNPNDLPSIANVPGLVDALALKAPLASPTFTGVVKVPDGTALAPSVALASGPTTGWYRYAVGKLGIALAGVVQAVFEAGTTNTLATTVQTRQKADARYAAKTPTAGAIGSYAFLAALGAGTGDLSFGDTFTTGTGNDAMSPCASVQNTAVPYSYVVGTALPVGQEWQFQGGGVSSSDVVHMSLWLRIS